MMFSQIITTHQGQLKIGTWNLSKDIGIQHRLLKNIIARNPSQFNKIVINKKLTNKRGGQIEEYLLSESQIRLLLAFLINHEKMKFGLFLFIVEKFESETDFFKSLEEYLNSLNK